MPTPTQSQPPAAGQAAHTPSMAHVQSHYRLYRCGSFGYAYNPNVKLWEVYEFDRDCGSEIVDLCGHENSKRQAHGEALRRNNKKREMRYEAEAQIEIGRVWDNPRGYWHAEVRKGSRVLAEFSSMVSEQDVREKAAFIVRACNSHASLVEALGATMQTALIHGATEAELGIARAALQLSKEGQK